MDDFENHHLSIIEEHEISATEVEKALFTGLYGLNEKHYALLSIQSLSILYSYWEGFIQKSFQMYIDYLNKKRLRFELLNDQIIIFHMENSFKQFKEYPDNATKKIAFYRKLRTHYSQNILPIFRFVDTDSNVGFQVLNRLMKQFGLETFSPNWGDYKYPNPNLEESLNTFVRYRNGIAHGGDISSEEKITQDVYARYRKLVSDLMYEIHDRFMIAIKDQTYLNEEQRKGGRLKDGQTQDAHA